ncbi:hypothetical protein [Streptomyces avicenniae]|uniref:hypothetical protein n=1 Tax=Streptomyces avicenniae TaxID=500153 RepID=UPI000A6922C4|nr:hypothetical protein [Streptomyces avicenniae]
MTPFASRLFPGGGGADDIGAAREWVRTELDAWRRSAAVPVVDALITAVRGRRPWWLSLRAHPEAVVAQVLRAKAARTPRLPAPLPGAEQLLWTYGITPTPDGLCIWTDISLPANRPAQVPPGRDPGGPGGG